jgi:hypothetical protein
VKVEEHSHEKSPHKDTMSEPQVVTDEKEEHYREVFNRLMEKINSE